MGGNGSKEQKPPRPAEQAETTQQPGATENEDVHIGERSQDSLGEAALQALRVKDPDAWRAGSPRPRSALKHGSSAISMVDSDGASNAGSTRGARKVSFQVQGLSAPSMDVGDGGSDGGAAGQHAAKRVRGTEEFSMKFLVEKFYNKVLAVDALKPFFEGVDMYKLKHQQEALMLLLFGGQELLDDELPGLSADLRLIHLHLLFEGLNLHHWQQFSDCFSQTLGELPQIPNDVKARALAYMATTQHHFRPIESHEWPPKVVYKGWTKRSCPFHTSTKRLQRVEDDDDDAFVLPGINAPPTSLTPAPTAAADDANAASALSHAADAAAAATLVAQAAEGAAAAATAQPGDAAAAEPGQQAPL